MEPSQWQPYGPQLSPYSPPPAGPSVVWAVLLWCLAVASLIGSLIFGGIAYTGYWSDGYLNSYGVTTTATVTDVQVFTGTVTVEFTSDGGTPVEADIWFRGDLPDVGDEVPITYDPSDPSYATEAGSDAGTFLAVVFLVGAVLGVIVMVGAIVGAVIVHRRRGKAARQRPSW